MQYRGFRTFCSAARHLSFKNAADELCITPSAVSHQIRDLEDDLGHKLFLRETRTIRLTAEGRQLFDDLVDHISAIEYAANRLRAQGARHRLCIELPAFFASELFVPRVGAFSAANQHIDLGIHTHQPGESQRNKTDLALILSEDRPKAKRAEALFPIHYQPACSPEFLNGWQSRCVRDLANTTLIVHEARPEAWEEWMQLSDIVRPPSAQTITVDSMYDLARAAQQGAGIALIPMPVSKQWFSSGRLVPLFEKNLLGKDSYWITSNTNLENNRSLMTLWNWIISEFQSTPEKTSLVS